MKKPFFVIAQKKKFVTASHPANWIFQQQEIQYLLSFCEDNLRH